MGLVGKSIIIIEVLIGDNCETNKVFMRKVSCPFFVSCLFFGCSSHRYNLAVNDIISNFSETFDVVCALMKRPKNPIYAAKLRQLSTLSSKCGNTTRFSSKFGMLRGYLGLREVLPKI